jgi:3-hydroxyacyl-[acyl-carrier-protein] dehydratase
MAVIEITIPADHPVFAGHFPAMPIVPGALLLDETLWAMADETGIPVTECIVTSLKFKRPVRPGEIVTLGFERTAEAGVRFELRSSGGIVASGAIVRATAAGKTIDER